MTDIRAATESIDQEMGSDGMAGVGEWEEARRRLGRIAWISTCVKGEKIWSDAAHVENREIE